ncbi:MAG: CocE/NonD family hydrolase [Candidatus Kapabacteria bacterium]|nr:CocE/NonD family hydrolase [Candidatus Kapabacteria bacterium]
MPIIIGLLCILLTSCSSDKKNIRGIIDENDNSYMKTFLNFKTNLTKKIKAPQEFYGLPSNMEDMDIIYYESEGLKLKAFLWNKNIDYKIRKPALIYFHGGFSVSYDELYQCKKFVDEGFIVLTPTYRGEIENPGFFECFLGEIKDAKESVKWLAKQPYIDTTRIYTFGHSIGGGISLMLSFHDDIPVKFSGSSAGLYEPNIFEIWNQIGYTMPFDINKESELIVRTPINSLTKMKREHLMYCGKEDEYALETQKIAIEYYAKNKLKLKFIEVNGDHSTSLENALNNFYEFVNQ